MSSSSFAPLLSTFVILLSCLAIDSSRFSSSLPLVLSPKVIRLLVPENLIILPFSNNSFILEIRTKDATVFSKFYGPKDRPYQVPIFISNCTSSQEAELAVINEDGDEHSSKVFLTSENGFGFIQTDKPIYSPKETVKIRIMRLDDDLRPIKDTIKLQIRNPARIIMDEAIFPGENRSHFIDYQFKIPPDPVKEHWFAVMSYGPGFSIENNVTFKVEEYVLPPFKLDLVSLPFISPSTKKVNGSVRAFYLSNGKPVSGSARFVFKVKTGKNVIPVGQTRDQPLIDGKSDYLFSIQEFIETNTWFPNVDGSRLMVEVIVIELSTGSKSKKIDDSTSFVNHPFSISFENAFKQFFPEQDNKLTAEILDVSQEPAPGVRTLMIVYERNSKTTRELVSDEFGRVEFLYKPGKVSSITYQISTQVDSLSASEQITKNHTLTRYKVNSGSLTIENRQDRFKVGQTYISKVSFEGSTFIFSHIYYALLIKGRIESFNKLPPDDVVQFPIEARMTPYFRLVVLSYRQDRIVSDSLLITVDEADCLLNVSYLDSKNVSKMQIKPGDTGSLVITSSPLSQVAIQAIDDAVYLLKSKNTLTRQKLVKIAKKKDHGCGPGGGLNSTDVILNAGLVLVGIESSKAGSFCREDHLKRARRSRLRAFDRGPKTGAQPDSCCKQALVQDKLNRSCSKRHSILLRHLKKYAKCGDKCAQHFCAKMFLACCEDANPVAKLAVAGMGSSSEDIARMKAFSPAITLELETELEEATLTRDDFRETWLFDILSVDQSGYYRHPITAPHSITSWTIDAVSLSAEKGLCMMDKPFKIQTSQQIFIRVDLPYSVVQDEQVEMLVNVFNYSPIDTTVTLYMYGPEGVCSQADSGQKTARRFIQLESGHSHSESFALLPLKPGEFDIKVVALSANMSDVVVRKLLVVPRGIEMNDEYRIQLDPQNRQRRNKRLVTFDNLVDSINPEKGEQKTTIHLNPRGQTIVPESEECIISAIADRFGPTVETSLKDLNHLIRKPGGCGEQNLLYMAPTLFTADYLNTTGKLTADQLGTAIKFLKEGYKQQLTFRNDDGSFSAFKSRKSSVWLTSFATRIFCKSAPYLGNSLDYAVISSAIDHIISRQKEEGSWHEGNPILHKKAMGGIRGLVPNTAFVLLSLKSCQKLNNFSNHSKLSRAILSAENYLCQQVNKSVVNAFTTALVAHSLARASCLSKRIKHQLLTDLNGLSYLDLDTNRRSWFNEPVTETAGYALMAYLSEKNLWRHEVQSTVNFLESKRTFSGAFESTQDTIVALEALAMYAKMYAAEDINLICNIEAGNFHKRIKFNPQNAQVMQTFDLQGDTDNIDISTNGTGIGSIQIRYKYNILEPREKLCGIELNVSISDAATVDKKAEEEFDFDLFFTTEVTEDLGTTRTIENGQAPRRAFKNSNSYELDRNYVSLSGDPKPTKESDFESKKVDKLAVCLRNYGNSNEENGMAIVEVGILSGYYVDTEELEKLIKNKKSLVTKYEMTVRSVIFYLESLPERYEEPFCISFKIIQQTIISNLQSALVKAYYYYSKRDGCSQLYFSTRRTDHLAKDCVNGTIDCQCVASAICPINTEMEEVTKIGLINMANARRRMAKIICSETNDFVWTGKVSELERRDQFYQGSFRIFHVYKGDQKIGSTANFTIDLRCGLEETLPQDSKIDRFLFIGKQKKNGIMHLNSKYYFYDLEAKSDRRNRDLIRNVLLQLKSQKEALTCSQSSN